MSRVNPLPLLANLLFGALLGFGMAELMSNISAFDGSRWFALCAGLTTLSFAFLSLQGAMAGLRAGLWALGLGSLTGGLFLLADVQSLFVLMQRDGALQVLLAWAVLSVAPLAVLRAAAEGQARSYPAIWAHGMDLWLLWGGGIGFALLSWMGIVPAMGLLESVGIEARDLLFSDERVAFALNGLLLAAGVTLVSIWRPRRAHGVLSWAMRLMALPFGLVMLVFGLGLLVNGIEGHGQDILALIGGSLLISALLITVIAQSSGRLPRAGGLWPMVAGALILLMLPAAAAALWSGVRGLQGGATPTAIAQLWLALFTALLAGGYGIAVVRGRSIGPVNLAARGLLCLWAILSLSGLLSPEALAARHQIARLQGGAALEDLPLRSMSLYWGKPGKAAIAQLRDRFAQEPAALAKIDAMTERSHPYSLPSP